MQKQPLTEWVAARGGVVHTTEARVEGYSGRAISEAVADGDVERVRRSWLVGTGCDAGLRAAAAAGGRLTCLSAARRRGLWVPPHDGSTHVAVKPTASRVVGEGLVVHWGSGPSPVPPHAVEDDIVNVLFHTSRCQPQRLAFAVWESAVRLKQVDAAVLQRVRWGSTAARELADAVSALSDSGTESVFVRDMRRLGLTVRQQVWIDGHPLDAQIGEYLLVQIDGFAHHSAASDRRRDLRADARLVLRGYTVLRFDWFQVLFDRPYVERMVLTAVAQGLHLVPERAGRRR